MSCFALCGATTIQLSRDVVKSDQCNFTGEVVFSHPMDIALGDKFFETAQIQLGAIELVIDTINTVRCGLRLDGKNVSIDLHTYGDEASKTKVTEITQRILNNNLTNQYFLGPYSSGLTGEQAILTHDAGKVLLAGGAASTTVFAGRNKTFGTFPPTSKYLESAVELLSNHGAKTVASFWEAKSFTRGVCAQLDPLATANGMEILYEKEVPSPPTEDLLDIIAQNLTVLDPEVVVTCTYAATCSKWIESMRKNKFSPKAQVFTVCVGQAGFEEASSYDAQYMSGVGPWDPSIPGVDAITGWTAAEFDEKFAEFTGRQATYHAASAAASVSILSQALETAGSDWMDHDKVSTILAGGSFPTAYGDIQFDTNGQSSAPVLAMQYVSDDIKVKTVFPESQKAAEFVYPMPTWEKRDCQLGKQCEGDAINGIKEVGVCTTEGICSCNNKEIFVPVGVGRNATCLQVPDEDYSLIPSSVKAVGTTLLGIQCFISLLTIVWTWYFQKRRVLRISQPVFLVIISIGCILQASSIIPMSIQGKYRFIQDELTRELSDEPNDDLALLDGACMAVYWLYFMGFALSFSALFAKILRVRKLYILGQSLKKAVVRVRDVVIIIVVMITVETALLLVWQFAGPLKWTREVTLEDANGYPMQSVGTCGPDHSWGWILLLCPFICELLILMYALYICYVTRNVPSEFAETKWITFTVGAIIEINVLGIPVMVLANNSSSTTFYFVRAGVVFLQSFTMTLFIFAPKFAALHFNKEAPPGESKFNRESSARVSVTQQSIASMAEDGAA